MLARDNRLRTEKEIEQVLKKKIGIFDEACGVRYAPNGLKVARVAFSVGKKVSLLAVVRNRIRRQYKGLWLASQADWPKGYDYVFLTAKPVLKLSTLEKKTRFYGILHKVQKKLA